MVVPEVPSKKTRPSRNPTPGLKAMRQSGYALPGGLDVLDYLRPGDLAGLLQARCGIARYVRVRTCVRARRRGCHTVEVHAYKSIQLF